MLWSSDSIATIKDVNKISLLDCELSLLRHVELDSNLELEADRITLADTIAIYTGKVLRTLILLLIKIFSQVNVLYKIIINSNPVAKRNSPFVFRLKEFEKE